MNDHTIGEMRENLNNALLRDYLDNRDNKIEDDNEPSRKCRKFTLEQRNQCNICEDCIFVD